MIVVCTGFGLYMFTFGVIRLSHSLDSMWGYLDLALGCFLLSLVVSELQKQHLDKKEK